MKCPKCDYITFDSFDSCPKCKANWKSIKEKLCIIDYSVDDDLNYLVEYDELPIELTEEILDSQEEEEQVEEVVDFLEEQKPSEEDEDEFKLSDVFETHQEAKENTSNTEQTSEDDVLTLDEVLETTSAEKEEVELDEDETLTLTDVLETTTEEKSDEKIEESSSSGETLNIDDLLDSNLEKEDESKKDSDDISIDEIVNLIEKQDKEG